MIYLKIYIIAMLSITVLLKLIYMIKKDLTKDNINYMIITFLLFYFPILIYTIFS